MEMALRVPYGKVFAIEKKELAFELLKKNKKKFATDNLTLIQGTAPKLWKNCRLLTRHLSGALQEI